MFGRKRSFSESELEVILSILRGSSDPAATQLVDQVLSVERVSRSQRGTEEVATAEYVKGEGPDVSESFSSTPIEMLLEDGRSGVFWIEIAAGGIFHSLVVSSSKPLRSWRVTPESLARMPADLLRLPQPNRNAGPALAEYLGIPATSVRGLLFASPVAMMDGDALPSQLRRLYEITDGFRIGSLDIFNSQALVHLPDGSWNFALDHDTDSRFILDTSGSVLRSDDYSLEKHSLFFEAADIREWLRLKLG